MQFLQLKSQYFGIAEQVLLSASNMLVSLFVVKVVGLEWFGIYSFIFVLTTLAGAFLSTLLHRQMTLEIANSSAAERRHFFKATIVIQTTIILAIMLILLLLMWFFSDAWLVKIYFTETLCAIIYVVAFNFYELFRQYLYVLNRQRYSFRCTVIFVVVLGFGLSVLFFLGVNEFVVSKVFLLLSIALLISLLSNRVCFFEAMTGESVGVKKTYLVLKLFFAQGRFRLVGMMVTWLQNQSMTPFLMWFGGPLVAGYYNVARLLVMPMAVVNQGLTLSTTPELRKIYQTQGVQSLREKIKAYYYFNSLFSLFFLLVLGVLHVTGVLEQVVPEYEEVKWYLLIWIAVLLLTMYRFWLGQHFVVSMQFRYMMFVSIASLSVSLLGMLTMALLLNNIYLALLFIAVGELLTIGLFNSRRNHELR